LRQVSRYPGIVDDRVQDEVVKLRTMLEEEIERSLPDRSGCWPLVVGVAGALLGVALLFGLL
jgi:hypothetical protein